MDVRDGWIPEADFATCLEYFPQVCVDVIVEMDGGVLLVRRTHEPAAGEWFWPGGRVYKGERLDAAVRRVVRDELGLGVERLAQLGVSEHFWEETAVSGLETRHTVPVVYRVQPAESLEAVELDDQHDEVRVLRREEPGLHEYVQAYLDRFDILQ